MVRADHDLPSTTHLSPFPVSNVILCKIELASTGQLAVVHAIVWPVGRHPALIDLDGLDKVQYHID
jgi:hypothetical protein